MGNDRKGKDRRSFVRHPTEIPVKISSASFENTISQNLKDVSEGGISFKSARKFSKGQLVEVTIPFVKPVFKSKGIVVWTKKDGSGFEIGIRFESPGDIFRLRMVEQICYIEAYRRKQLENKGRRLSSEEAAREWIARYASSFPLNEE